MGECAPEVISVEKQKHGAKWSIDVWRREIEQVIQAIKRNIRPMAYKKNILQSLTFEYKLSIYW